MEIRELQTFRTVVEQESFTRAAEALRYAQSTITGHIQALESEIGVPLFHRLGKRIQMTEAGKELYAETLRLFEIHARMLNIGADNQAIRGTLRIGAAESVILYKMKPILTAFVQMYPEVHLSLIHDTCSELRRKVMTGELDMALTLEPEINHSDLFVSPIEDVDLYILGGPFCRVQTLVGQNSDFLMEECIIFTEKDCAYRSFFEDYLRQKGFHYRNRLEFTSIATLMQCVMSGLGIALLPAYCVEEPIKEGLVTRITCEDPLMQMSLQLSRHKNKWLSPAQEEFWRLIETQLGRPVKKSK